MRDRGAPLGSQLPLYRSKICTLSFGCHVLRLTWLGMHFCDAQSGDCAQCRVHQGCWGPDGPLEGLSEDASPPWQYDLRGRGLGPGSTAPGRSVYVGDSLGDIEGLLEVRSGLGMGLGLELGLGSV